MFARTKSVVGLDLGTSAIKAVELTQNGKDIEVTGFGHVEVPADDLEARVSGIQDLMREGGFRSRRVVTSISGKMVIIRYLSMVSMSDNELKNAIAFEAEKYVPFPLDQCVLDCQRVDFPGDASQSGNMNVLLVAARRAQIEDHVQTVIDAGLSPWIVDVDAFALGNAYELNHQVPEDEDTVIAFVDVGASKTNVNVVRGTTSLFTREISVGGKDFTDAISRRLNISWDEAEELKREGGHDDEMLQEAVFPVIGDLTNEIQLSFDYFENQNEREVDAIQLSGGGAQLPSFQESFERIFEKPISTFNPFEGLLVNEDIDVDLLTMNAPQLAVAVGLAARLNKE